MSTLMGPARLLLDIILTKYLIVTHQRYSVHRAKMTGRLIERYASCLQVMQRLRELGVLIGKGGLHGNVFRIKPPMCITTDDAEFLTEAFDLALSEL